VPIKTTSNDAAFLERINRRLELTIIALSVFLALGVVTKIPLQQTDIGDPQARLGGRNSPHVRHNPALNLDKATRSALKDMALHD